MIFSWILTNFFENFLYRAVVFRHLSVFFSYLGNMLYRSFENNLYFDIIRDELEVPRGPRKYRPSSFFSVTYFHIFSLDVDLSNLPDYNDSPTFSEPHGIF